MDSHMCKIHRLCKTKNKTWEIVEKYYIEWRIHRELRIHHTQSSWMRELATPRHTKYWIDDEIECFQPLECPTDKSI